MNTRALALAGLFALFAFPSVGICKDGNELLEKLRSSNPVDNAYAFGYINSVANYEDMVVTKMILNSMASNTKQNGASFLLPVFCPPSGATAGQLTDIVRQYLEANPSIRQRAAIALVRDAAIKAWPCVADSSKSTKQ